MRKTITLTESDLHTIIKESIAKIIEELDNAKYEQMIIEGVHYDSESDSFIFDFENDYETDIIKLKKVGYKVLAFNHCYYFGYQFETDIDSSKRTKFIHSIKFPDGKISERDKNSFIINAVNKLDSDITLPSYDLIVYPESMSEINREMLKYLNRFASPEIVNMELIKSLSSKIEFDYNRFNIEVLDGKLSNGRDRYTPQQKEEVIKNIQAMIDSIHNLEYFSIARDVKKTKYRQYIRKYYTFKDENDRQLFETIQNTNILIIDDIVTSGTTISHLLKCLRSVNDTNNIVIFSLIGKNID
jgi:hypothetical protein